MDCTHSFETKIANFRNRLNYVTAKHGGYFHSSHDAVTHTDHKKKTKHGTHWTH